MAQRSSAARFAWRTWLPQFSLRTLLVWMALVAMAMVGLANASRFGAQVALAVVLGAAGITILAICFGEPNQRRRAVGRLVFGSLFFAWAVAHLDQWATQNGVAAPRMGSVTEPLNDLLYQGISRLRNSGQPQTIQFLASPYLSPSNVTGATNTAYYNPAIASGVPYSLDIAYPQSLAPSLATQYAFFTAPAVFSNLREFQTIADCFWTLVLGACGGWLAMVIYRRPTLHQEEKPSSSAAAPVAAPP
jgi:hypothetical protein